jgi:hypothetical protein
LTSPAPAATFDIIKAKDVAADAVSAAVNAVAKDAGVEAADKAKTAAMSVLGRVWAWGNRKLGRGG